MSKQIEKRLTKITLVSLFSIHTYILVRVLKPPLKFIEIVSFLAPLVRVSGKSHTSSILHLPLEIWV